MKRMLKYYRSKNNMTQADLAIKVGLATVSIRKIENGSRNPSNMVARRISIVLGTTMDKVFPDIFLLSDDTKRTNGNLKQTVSIH